MARVVSISSYELRNNAETFRCLGKLHKDLSSFENEEIEIDCSKLSWFDAHLSGPLRTIVNLSKLRNNRHKLTKVKNDIRDILSKNGFLKRKLDDVYGTTMPVKSFTLDESKDFAAYAKRNLSRPEMPKMTLQLQRKFHEGIDEIFANCSLHSYSKVEIIAAGQIYPRKHLLTISISDGGIGIVGSLKKAGIPIRNHSEAISWAMQKNNTSRQGDIPGGLGLAVLQEFISKNSGKLIISSKSGYWCQSGKEVVTKKLDYEFPGTCVIIEINSADKKSYDLKAPVSKDDIW
ncbi:hypothetical protein ABE527_10890 [Brucella sp. TWI432]